MGKELIITPSFKPSEENPDLLIYHFDKNYTVKEMSLHVHSRQILLTMVKKPKKAKAKKKSKITL